MIADALASAFLAVIDGGVDAVEDGFDFAA